MEQHLEALQTQDKDKTIEKWQKNMPLAMLLLVIGRGNEAKLKCTVLTDLQMKC